MKKPTTVDEQVNLLQSRKLKIKNKYNAINFFSNINYYRFSGYTYFFRNRDDTFNHNISFEDIQNIYYADKELRNILMKYLSIIEICFKRHISYEVSHAIYPNTYLQFDSKIYNDKQYFDKFISKLNKEKYNNKEKKFIKHHEKKYNHELPLWVATEILTFGEISKYYNNLKKQYAKLICKYYHNIDPKTLKSWFGSLTLLRNMCAHHSRLFKEKINFTLRGYNMLIFPNKTSIGHTILIMGILLPKKECLNMIDDILEFEKKYKSKFFSLNSYQLNKNWIMLIEKTRNDNFTYKKKINSTE